MKIESDVPIHLAENSLFGEKRRLPLAPLVLAYALATALATFANFLFFRSSFFDGLVDLSSGVISKTLVANVVLMVIVIGSVLVGWGKASWNELGLRPPYFRLAIIVSAVTWIGIQGLTLIIALASGKGIARSPGFESSAIGYRIGEFLGQIFGNALYEEVLFRGVFFVQAVLWIGRTKQRIHSRELVCGLIISQTLFALSHIPNRVANNTWPSSSMAVLDLLGLVVIGVLFALVYWRTGSLLTVVGFHALLNIPWQCFRGAEWIGPTVVFAAIIGLICCGSRPRPHYSSNNAST